MSHENPTQQQTVVPVLMGATAFVGVLLFLILISGGFFFYVFLGLGLMFLVGSVHYAMWGQAMNNETEGEREEERRRDEAQTDPW
jgi:hypothetical protein